MTSKLEVVQEWLDAAADDYDAAYEYFADDFQWVQTDGVVMDRAAYLGMANLLRSALPDLEHVVGEVREEDGSVLLISHFEGTHENDLDLSAMGMGVFPASGKKSFSRKAARDCRFAATKSPDWSRFQVRAGWTISSPP